MGLGEALTEIAKLGAIGKSGSIHFPQIIGYDRGKSVIVYQEYLFCFTPLGLKPAASHFLCDENICCRTLDCKAYDFDSQRLIA